MFGFGKKKEEKEDKKEDEEKKEENVEEKQDDEEEEEEVEDSAPEDEDDFTLYPLEAQDWAKKTLGDPSYAKYYQIAKHRSEGDALEMLTRRNWHVTIKNIHFTNQGKEHDVFLKFCFGHNLRVSRRFKRSKGEIEGGGGGGPPGKGKHKPAREFEWVVQGTSGMVRLTEVKKKVAKGSRVDYDEEFSFGWSGSYFDLFKKNLHVEVWDWNFLSPNTYIASYESSLRDICSGAMDQDWDIYTEIRKRGKVEKVNVGSLHFTVIFQEVLEYTVKLSNWNATLNVESYMSLEEDQVQDIVPFALFHLHSPFHTYGSSKRLVSKPVRHQIKGKLDWLKVDFGQLREMKFKGTRMDFESGELFVTIYDNTQDFMPTPIASKALAFAVIPLKAVIEVGVLSSHLTKATKGGSAAPPAMKVAGAYLSSAATNAGDAVLKQVSAATGSVKVRREREVPLEVQPQSSSVGTIRGNLDVEVLPPKLGVGSILNPAMVLTKCLGYSPLQFNLWREFAQVGEPNPPELRDYPPYNQAYLCVRVIQARNLFPADDTGTSDPYVVVRWGDQELKTRIMFCTLRPDFHEELYFLVRSNDPKNIRVEELARIPEIKILVYDFDPAGSSDLLGETSVYLHQITGCGVVDSMSEEDDEQMRRIPTKPAQSVVVRRRSNPGAPLRPQTIQTRVFKSELPLHGVPPDYKSTILVECFFRTWEGDLKERNPAIRNKTHSDFIVLPPLKILAKEKDTPCMCHSVFAFEQSAVDAIEDAPTKWELHRKMCPPSRPQLRKAIKTDSDNEDGDEEAAKKLRGALMGVGEPNVCVTLAGFRDKLSNPALPSRSYLYKKELDQDPPGRKSVTAPRQINVLKWDLKNTSDEREPTLDAFLKTDKFDCSDFLAKDIFGNRHWLPQFLHPLTPPKAMIQDPEEAKYMVIVSSKLPNAQFAAAQLVKSIEFWDMEDYHISSFSESTWIDPATLLTMKKGDLKAHALLLCNLFLGLQTDAYVCLGYARTDPTKKEVLDLRERAREGGWPSKKFEAELEKLRGKLTPCVWVMTRESSGESEYGEAYKNIGSVKFWDVARGCYYPPLPGRWRGQDDDEKFRQFKKPQKKSNSGKPSKAQRNRTAQGGKDAKPGAAGVPAAEQTGAREKESRRAPVQPLLKDMREEELLEDEAGDDDGIGRDVGVNVNEVFALGVGTGDDWGRGDDDDEDRDYPEEVEDGMPAANDRGQSALTATTTGAAKPLGYEPYKMEDLAKSGWTSRFKRIMGKRQTAQEEEIRKVLPYTHIVAIFNHKNLWVNAQHYLNPTKLTYDLGSEDFGWIPVLRPTTADHTQPFYPAKTLTPKLTEDRVAALRTQVEDELEAGLTNFRSSNSIATKFAPLTMKKLLRKYLENLHQLSELDHSRKNGWIPSSDKEPVARFDPSSQGYVLTYRLQRLKELIINTVPPGFKFRIGTAIFHSIDPTDIRLKMLSHAWRTKQEDWVKETASGKDRDPEHSSKRAVQIQEESHDGREIFCIAASVFPYYNQICSVGVCIVVIFPQERHKY